MFPYTHVYATHKILETKDPLVIYGSIVPDLAATGLIPWGMIDSTSLEFRKYLIKNNKKLSKISMGIMLHENPCGIDRFTHTAYKGKTGYAYQKAKQLLLKEPLMILTLRKDAFRIAHNFIETGVEYMVVKNNKEIVKLLKNTVKEINEKEIAKAISNFYGTGLKKTEKAIKEYNKMITNNDSSTVEGLTDMWIEMAKLTGKNPKKKTIKRIIEKSIEIVKPDYKEFLNYSINRCKQDIKEYIK